MEEHPRTPEFRKDDEQEKMLARMNVLLESAQAQLETQRDRPRLPVILIIGPPRAGTTLISQLLRHVQGLGYISNFLARFWLAPAVGCHIEKALGLMNRDPAGAYISRYGVTQGWAQPHEFGYFWDRWFDLGQLTHQLGAAERERVDKQGLLRALASIEGVNGKPMVFKNNTWCTLQADFLNRLLPRSVFVVCRRHPLFIAQSLLCARRDRLGNESLWWSVRPSRYREIIETPWWEQVVLQAIEVDREMMEALDAVPGDRLVWADYDKVCKRPHDVVSRVVEECRALGAEVGDADPLPAGFQNRNTRRISEAEWTKLESAMERYGSGWPRLCCTG